MGHNVDVQRHIVHAAPCHALIGQARPIALSIERHGKDDCDVARRCLGASPHIGLRPKSVIRALRTVQRPANVTSIYTQTRHALTYHAHRTDHPCSTRLHTTSSAHQRHRR